MRFTAVLLLASLMQVSAASFAQKISMSKSNATLKVVLREIKAQSGYNFVITQNLLKRAKPVSINVKAVEVEDVLNQVFANQDLVYSIDSKTVVIKEKVGSTFVDNIIARFQAIDVRGRVVDQNNSPLLGATIKVKGSTVGVTSDEKGDFTLKNVEEGANLEISFIGFAPMTIAAKEDMGIIKMNQVNAKLDEVIVQAYGTTTQRYSTGNIGTITSEGISKQPVSNPLLALQGRVPGLFITQSSGVSASNVDVNIQGRNSLLNGSEPFYVIDGVPFNPQFLTQTLMGTSINGNGGSSFNFINPADIESVSILKDADATAIYGSRAANGAILITTKKGKAGKTKVDVNLRNGWGKIVKKLDLMNTEEYLSMRREAYVNAGQAVPTSSDVPLSSNYDLTVWDQNRYTDWQDVLVGGTAHFTDIQASISGGSANTQFLGGYGYNRQTTVYPNSLADVKGNVHLNINHSSNNSKFKYMMSATYLQDKNRLNGADLMGSVFLSPNAPALYKLDGSLNWESYPNEPTSFSFDNPLSAILTKYMGNTSNMIVNNTLSYEVMPNLHLKINGGYNRLEGDEIRTIPYTSIKPDATVRVRSASFLSKSINSWIVEPQLTYNKMTNFGVFDILLGTTFQQSRNNLLNQTGTNYSNDAQLENLQSAPNLSITNTINSLYKYNAVFARVNYRIQERYIINLTARRDGSSRFGDSNKFNNFYGIGAAWLFSENEFIEKSLPFLSQGKLRASYGTTGNDQIGDYQYLSLLETYPATLPYQGSIGLYPTRISNSFLQWEETKKANIGLDLGFLKNKLLINLNYFRNRSSNQLINYSLPYITGFANVRQNFPATIQNTGFEGQLDFTAVKNNSLNWQLSGNITVPRNKLIAFKDLETSTYVNDLILGKPFNIIKAYKFAGVNSVTGLYEFYDSKGEKTSTPNSISDRTELVDLNPKWYAGISNSFQYMGFNFDFLFQFVKQEAPNYKFGNLPGATVRNQLTNIGDRWRKSGDVSEIQQASLSNEAYDANSLITSSDVAYSGASYIRLKNASISYSLPEALLNPAHISRAIIYIQGQNLLTFSNYIGTDPETLAIGSLPPLKMFTIGLKLTL